ncbi:MAG: imidazole glycerol phosphate synthase subunit HisF [Elusimicrobia bacterium]|nr:imidazole glycerol phosphate synthase subunit HisF [Elusimicrobiota bacterium]
MLNKTTVIQGQTASALLDQGLRTRIIPRLDIKGPNLVKGISFDGFRVLGTPNEMALLYYQEGADELLYYDTVASLYQRNSLKEIVRRTAEETFVPLTVAGGIRTIEDIREILRSGADKVAINTAAVNRPEFLKEAAQTFGSQCIVLSIEAKRLANGSYEAWVNYGRQPTGVDAVAWALRGVGLGAGEILLTSIDREGTAKGFDLDLIRKIGAEVDVPVIASGGAGKKEHMAEAVLGGKADAVSAAALFHYHYMKRVDTLYMSSNHAGLRMGQQVDEGNIDFLRAGAYSGLKESRYQPMAIPQIKDYLARQGVACRAPTRSDREVSGAPQ